MKNIFTIGFCLLIEVLSFSSFAQKKVTVLGSSTAAGNGAWPIDSSWVSRLRTSFNKNTGDGIDTIVNNRAVAGYVTYKSLPTGYPIPAGRPDPDPNANVTYVLNDVPRADVVVISYPSNDVLSGYDPKEMMDNLRVIYQQLTSNGIRCYITSSQPRNDASDAQRATLRQLRDSIINNFGLYSIIFWDDLATSDGLNRLRDEVNSGDGIHPNNFGHRLLFQEVQAKNILSAVAGAPLPLRLKDWQARLENNAVKIKWSSENEELNSSFEIERSENGRDFKTVYQTNAKGKNADYSWEDLSPLKGKSFYRLKIIEPNKFSYSKTIEIINDKKQPLISKFYANASSLHIEFNSLKNQAAAVSIINYSGVIVKKQNIRLTVPNTTIAIPISELISGQYFLRVTTSDGITVIEPFNKLK